MFKQGILTRLIRIVNEVFKYFRNDKTSYILYYFNLFSRCNNCISFYASAYNKGIGLVNVKIISVFTQSHIIKE